VNFSGSTTALNSVFVNFVTQTGTTGESQQPGFRFRQLLTGISAQDVEQSQSGHVAEQVAEMGDRLVTIDMGRNVRGCSALFFFGGGG